MPEREPDFRTTYCYVDENGELLFQVCRFVPKDFRQRRPDGRGGWTWNLDGVRRLLYRLPAVVEAAKAGARVFVVEGERDVHAVEQAGGVATCNPGGAGKWRDQYATSLIGAKVVVVADRDEPGYRHAEQVAESLAKVGVTATIIHTPDPSHKDVSDMIAAGGTLDDLVPVHAAGSEASRHRDDRPGNTIRASDVTAERVKWLWPGRVPLGMVTVIGGFPGVGKSTVNYDLAARTSREGKAVLVVTAEDHLAAVVRPRLEAAGADLHMVHIVTVPITLPDDVAVLERLVHLHEVALLILDPLVAFIGDGVNTHRDHHVRRVLAPLSDLAERTMAAVVVVIHTNKGESAEPLMRISGSVGFTGAARSVLLAADDPSDDARRILAVAKSNLAEFPPPLAYRIAGVVLENEITTSRIEWLGEAPEVDVRELLARHDPQERTQVDEAMEFLRDAGVLEAARPARDIERDAESLGIHGKALQRARRKLNVPAWKDGFPGIWHWGPNRTPELDTGTVVQMSSSARPAGTGVVRSDLDVGHGFGEAVPHDGDAGLPDDVKAAARRVMDTFPGTIDVTEALVMIADERAQGRSDEQIAILLATGGWPPPEGFGGWTGSAVRTVAGGEAR